MIKKYFIQNKIFLQMNVHHRTNVTPGTTYAPDALIFFAIAFMSSNSSCESFEKSSNSIISFTVFMLGMWWSDFSRSTLVPFEKRRKGRRRRGDGRRKKVKRKEGKGRNDKEGRERIGGEEIKWEGLWKS